MSNTKYLLVIDVGNTNIVMGVYEDKHLRHNWRLHSNRNATEDEFAMTFKHILQHVGINFKQIEGVIISSVVPPLSLVLKKLTEKYLTQTPLVLGAGIKTGLNIKYENPRDVGADRIANAVAGIDKYGTPLIIVDFGTATTFCYIDEAGDYIGGNITPGVSISAEALYQRAAKLTRVEIVKPDQIVGRNTVQAMQSGIYYGYVGLVDGMVSKMIEKIPGKKPTVIATGGLAQLICTETNTIDEVDHHLTLEGLRMIYERNKK
ncbi:type III pantothenate kinase [Hazenella sp. IB182357]|uniref:Type III pantothenate kinase n=1 Tax=Polycladospora coralii TaxID=2771432 RepID=A0A926N6M7_9BACL|nr:type III pantothenate kinase [Polycladospora coralii]MBD1372446.1 type III pantothenate kinase [Polycladospora coralii]MBS7531768.1 type III pantothenate kinase [Polycladospora coralii]